MTGNFRIARNDIVQIEGELYHIPADIKLVETIESTGLENQIIDTQIAYSSANKIVVDLIIKSSTTRSLLGFGTDASSYFGKDTQDRYEMGTSAYMTPPPDPTTRHTVVFETFATYGKITVDGKTTQRSGSFTGSGNFSTGLRSYLGNGNIIYSIYAYNNDTLVGAMLPGVKNNVAGLYDPVRKLFLSPNGGTLIAGKTSRTVSGGIVEGEYYDNEGQIHQAAGYWRLANRFTVTNNYDVDITCGNESDTLAYVGVETADPQKCINGYTVYGEGDWFISGPDSARDLKLWQAGEVIFDLARDATKEVPLYPTVYFKPVLTHLAQRLWGRYIPAVASDPTTYPMVLKNLFDEATVTKGEFYNDSGVLTINEATYYSDNIPASQGDVFTISRESNITTVYLRIHAFNADGTWLAMIGKSAGTTSTSVTSSACPANTAYIVVCGAHRNGAIDPHTMVVKGSTAHLYVPYGSWKFVKDTVTNTFGYYNEETGEYVAAQGATGTVIQPISYAESDGTAWADTGIYGSEKTKITIDFQKTDNTQTNMQIIGSNTNTSNAITCNMGSSGNNVSRFGSENKTVALFKDLNRHTLTVANDGYIADGTNVWTPNAAAFTTPDTLLLLSTQNSTSRFVGKVYSANLTEDGTLVRDYLPVRIGTTVELLDLVNWQFATRTGTFTAGADIPPLKETSTFTIVKEIT